MKMSYDNYNLLKEINNALAEIYTKGQDSITIVRVREVIFKILNDLQTSLTEEQTQEKQE